MNTRSCRGIACLVALVLCAAACSGSGKAAVSVRVATDTRAEIHDAHLTRPVLIDGGILRLDPLSGTPPTSEVRAIGLFRASGFAEPESGDVSVVYAYATLRLALLDDRAFVNRPRSLPMFHHRPAWVIISPMAPFFGCREGDVTNSSAPERQRVELIAADGSGDGLLYRTGGSLCEQAVRPQVAVATYDVSLPWTVVSRTGSRVVIRYAAPPACGAQDGVDITSSPTTVMFDVEASVLLASPPCTPLRPASTIVESAPPTATLLHPITGPVINSGLTYYDGTTHTIK